MRSATACRAHRHGYKVPIDAHHVMPRRWHGPTIATNLVNLCPNAHRDVHTMLTALLNGRPVDRRDFGPIVRQLADRGYREVMASAQQLADAHKATQAGERS